MKGKGEGKWRREKGKGKGKEKWIKEKGRRMGREGGKNIALKCRTHGCTHGRTDTKVILHSVQCYALHWTDNKGAVDQFTRR